MLSFGSCIPKVLGICRCMELTVLVCYCLDMSDVSYKEIFKLFSCSWQCCCQGNRNPCFAPLSQIPQLEITCVVFILVIHSSASKCYFFSKDFVSLIINSISLIFVLMIGHHSFWYSSLKKKACSVLDSKPKFIFTLIHSSMWR